MLINLIFLVVKYTTIFEFNRVKNEEHPGEGAKIVCPFVGYRISSRDRRRAADKLAIWLRRENTRTDKRRARRETEKCYSRIN